MGPKDDRTKNVIDRHDRGRGDHEPVPDRARGPGHAPDGLIYSTTNEPAPKNRRSAYLVVISIKSYGLV
jgi:hypothetical protein